MEERKTNNNTKFDSQEVSYFAGDTERVNLLSESLLPRKLCSENEYIIKRKIQESQQDKIQPLYSEEKKKQQTYVEDEEEKIQENGEKQNQQHHPLMEISIIRKMIYQIYSADGTTINPQLESQYRQMYSYGREPFISWKNVNVENPKTSQFLKVATITWNLKGSCPIQQLEEFVSFVKQSKHHIVAIATQECERSICASFFNSSKTAWEKAVIKSFGIEYLKVKSVKMNALHLIVLHHVGLRGMIAKVQTDTKSTGLCCYQVGNKGGIAISMKINGKSYAFVNVHLASGMKEKERRNQDLSSIDGGLILGREGKHQCTPKLSDRFDYVFFLGDFNSRINIQIPLIDLERHDYISLLLHDQLLQERELEKFDFNEGMITFPPSYKLEIYQNKFYSGKKKRQPAWTDRILFKSENQNTIFLESYDCCTTTFGSDHRPVYAQFLVQNIQNEIVG